MFSEEIKDIPKGVIWQKEARTAGLSNKGFLYMFLTRSIKRERNCSLGIKC
jgi:hypothetical protein